MSMSAPNVSGSISGISPNCDELLAVIVSSAGAPPDVIPKRLLPALKNASSQIFLLSTSDGKDPLTVLDPEKNTIGFLYFVTTRSYIDRPNNVPGLIQHLVNFINKFDPEEAKLAIDRWSGEILEAYGYPRGIEQACIRHWEGRLNSGHTLSITPQPVLAIRPLVTAIQRLAPTPAHLTTLHYRFIKICLLSKHYKDALAVLDNDIEEVDPQTRWFGTCWLNNCVFTILETCQRLSINVEDVLLYHYYGGMAYIGMKRFDRALEFFSLVISSPSQVTSAIQIEAHKKYVLVSLLEHGKLLPLPKYTTQVVLRVFKNNCGGYLEFAQAFESLNVTRVKNEFAKVADMFTKDKNLGLARQVLQALYCRNIQQLTQTYMTLSLADIAKQVGLEGPRAVHEAEELVVQMVRLY
ncbi:hypothetical protein BC938DRAFT_481060 [Jimgerdemannia flammicorona]|uniref:COP9 signalosome complex subunit 3 n=1 Tax=Jimgerdemannia flammicorona TaxID=994334 RepID=A0A433QX07_9FUNG|nr:hypothetical protein BC938DRAFT_481060 [Jimgerdemannia flammicorona]